MIKKIMLSTIVILTLVSALIFAVPDSSSTSGVVSVSAATQAELEAKQAKLEKEQASIKSKLSSLKANKSSAQEQVDQINLLVENLQSQIDTLNSKITAMNEEIATVEAEIQAKEDEINANYDKFKSRLRAMYMTGDMSGGLEVLLSSDGFEDMLSRTYYIEKMADHDQAIIDSLTADKAGYIDKKADLDKKKAQLDKEQEELAAKKTELDAQKAEADALLKQIEEEQAALEAEQKKIDAEMDTAKAQLDMLIGAESKKDVGSKYVGGSFKWPTPGYGTVTSPYGWRWGRMHKGIDIGAPTGAKIIASNEGKVVTSSYQASGYGNYVIINHGGGYMTVYGHMSKRLVAVGQYVAKGQTIGKVGSTGRSTGPHLHFEIRVNGSAVNPRNYV